MPWAGGSRLRQVARSSLRTAGALRDMPGSSECLEFALADLTIIGLWGGTDDAERRQMRRQVA